MQNNLGLFLSKRAHLSPDREAYIDSHSGLRLTFTGAQRAQQSGGQRISAAGVEKGERVALLLMNSAEFMEAYFALAKIGAVVVPLNWRLVADELEFILKDSGPARLIFDNDFVDYGGGAARPGDRPT